MVNQTTNTTNVNTPKISVKSIKALFGKIHDFVMRQSLNSQILDFQKFQQFWNGKVIALIGGSTAGKSTIVNSLRKIVPNMQEEGPDITGARLIYDYMDQKHTQFGITKEDWKHLHRVLIPKQENWHIHDAVGLRQELPDAAFKKEATEEDKKRAIETASKLFPPVDSFVKSVSNLQGEITLEKTLLSSKMGIPVVFDIFDVDEVNDHPIATQSQVQTVFVFCPFDQLSQRLTVRNQKAISGETGLNEVRAGPTPFLQYAELIRPFENRDSVEDIIDTITKQEVEKVFEENFEAGIKIMKNAPGGQKTLNKMIEEESLESRKNRDRKEFLKAFGFQESDSPIKRLKYVPKKNYDRVINTGKTKGNSPIERGNSAAMQILKN